MASGGRYAGKVVIVTGGGRGIGAGIVRAFGEWESLCWELGAGRANLGGEILGQTEACVKAGFGSCSP